jgi:hypothetical protein
MTIGRIMSQNPLYTGRGKRLVVGPVRKTDLKHLGELRCLLASFQV